MWLFDVDVDVAVMGPRGHIHQPFFRTFFVLFSRFFFLFLEAFECNTTCDWLNHIVKMV